MVTEHIETAYCLLADAITEIEAFVQDAKPVSEDGENNLNKIDSFLNELKKLFMEMDSTFMEITDQPPTSRCSDCGIRLGLGEVHECEIRS